MTASEGTRLSPPPGDPAAPPGTSGPGNGKATVEPGTPARKLSGWSLPLRIASGVLFVPLLLLLTVAGREAFLAFVALQVALGLVEFYRLMRGAGLQPHSRFGILAGLLVVWVSYRPFGTQADFLATAALILVLAFGLRRPEVQRQVESMAVTIFGVIYVGWLSAHLVRLRELPWTAGTEYSEGAAFVFLAFFITWSCDTGAYAFGRWLGRTRPWTRISPKKSVEGAIGGFACAIVAAFVARAWFAPFLRPWDAAALGLLVGVFAQVGDLVESMFKRHSRAGDSSALIPGHGGVLDRFDSLYFGAPLVFYYLELVVFQVP